MVRRSDVKISLNPLGMLIIITKEIFTLLKEPKRVSGRKTSIKIFLRRKMSIEGGGKVSMQVFGIQVSDPI